MAKNTKTNGEASKGILEAEKRLLIAKSAGRCEFRGCNSFLFEDELTTLCDNFSEQAHILPKSEKGPRYRFINDEDLDTRNRESNLMLLCEKHHHEIDSRKHEALFSPDVLLAMKREHEDRIRLATQIIPESKTHLVIYEGIIGNEMPKISDLEVASAVFPKRYPVNPEASRLSLDMVLPDTHDGIWELRRSDLVQKFNTFHCGILQRTHGSQHVSLFALGSIPLLIQLGVLFAKINTSVYHPRLREQGWCWEEEAPKLFKFSTRSPNIPTGKKIEAPVLILSISGTINDERIHAAMGANCHIWEISVPREFCNTFSIRCKSQVKDFSRIFRSLLEEIKAVSAQGAELHIFPAIPVPIAVELGRCRLEKCDIPWTIYDQNPETNAFIKTITIK